MIDIPSAKNTTNIRSARGKNRLRWLVRIFFLVVALVTFFPGLKDTWLPIVVPSLSPFVAISSMAATGTVSLWTWIGLVFAVVAIARRRWFCRWVCPTGTCSDFAARAGIRLRRSCPRIPSLGQWIAFVTIGGALLGYPVLLWLDPLAIFGGFFGVTHDWSPSIGWWYALCMSVVLLLSVVWPGIWCARLCPLGALFDGLSLSGDVVKRNVSSSKPVLRSAADRGLSRRFVLGALAGIGLGAATRPVRAGAGSEQPLRPPGAIDENRFVGVCVRCGNCLRACPSSIIQPDAGQHGIASLLTPVLDFENDYCREDCVRCTQVCPSGALAEIVLEDKQQIEIGFPHVDMDICLLGEDRECALCRNWCPYAAITYKFSSETYMVTPQIDPDKCNGCGACETACPTEPVKAIRIVTE